MADRLISADALKAALQELYLVAGWKKRDIHFSLSDMECNIDMMPTIEAVPLEYYRSMEQTVYKLTQALAEAEPIKMMCNGAYINCPAHKDYERGYKDGQAEAQMKAEPTKHYNTESYKMTVMDFPPVEYAPIKHGRWEQIVHPWYECSECGERTAVVNLNGEVVWNYCPNCGAKMDE